MNRTNKPMKTQDVKELITIKVFKTYYERGVLKDKKLEESLLIFDYIPQMKKIDAIADALTYVEGSTTTRTAKYEVKNDDLKEWVYLYRRYYNS